MKLLKSHPRYVVTDHCLLPDKEVASGNFFRAWDRWEQYTGVPSRIHDSVRNDIIRQTLRGRPLTDITESFQDITDIVCTELTRKAHRHEKN